MGFANLFLQKKDKFFVNININQLDNNFLFIRLMNKKVLIWNSLFLNDCCYNKNIGSS